jgi:hypothetical protein
MPGMARSKRARETGEGYIKYGSYYGRGWTPRRAGGRIESSARFVGGGPRDGLTRTQAEKRLRELMSVVQAMTNPDRTLAAARQALLEHLEAKARARSHIESVGGASPCARGPVLRGPTHRSHRRRSGLPAVRPTSPELAGAEGDPEHREIERN